MSDAPRCFALVPCAGVGTRADAGGPKQYARIKGQPVVAHTLNALAAVARIDATLVVLAADDSAFESQLPGFGGARGWVARCGGATRAESVRAGLAALRDRGAGADDWVLVHDAARCLLQPAWVERLIGACIDDAVGGLLALPLGDTLKQGAGDRVASTLPRDSRWLAQTPQMFRLGLLEQALARVAQAGEPAITDESSAIEALGHAPRLVVGDAENFKITWPTDLALAARLLETRP